MIRTALRVILALLTIGALLALALLVALNLGGATWAVNQLLRRVNPYPGTTMRVGGVTGSFLTGIQVRDARMTGRKGEVVIEVERVSIGYDPRRLLSRDIVIREVRAVKPKVVLGRFARSRWDLAQRPLRSSEPKNDSTPDRLRVSIDRAFITQGSLWMRSDSTSPTPLLRVEGVESSGRRVTLVGGFSIGQVTAAGRALPRGASPGWTAIEAHGSIEADRLRIDQAVARSAVSAVRGNAVIPMSTKGRPPDPNLLTIHVSAPRLAIRDLSPLHRLFDREGGAAVTADARGTASGLNLKVDATFWDGGTAAIEGFLSGSRARLVEYRGHATLRGFDPALLLRGPSGRDRVDGELRLDLRGPTEERVDGTASVRIHDARYASVTARGLVGEARFVGGRGKVNLDGEIAGLGVRLRGWLRPLDPAPSYDLAARVRRPTAHSGGLERLLGPGPAELSLRAAGRGFDPSRADATIEASLVRGPRARGLVDSGTVLVRLAAGVGRVRGRIGATGGLMAIEGQVSLTDGIRYRIDQGTVSRMKLAALLGDSTPSELNASFRGEGRGVGKDSIRVTGHVQIDTSYFGASRVIGAQAEIALAARTARLDGEASLHGGAVEVTATSRPFDASPRLDVQRLRFTHLDIQRLVRGTRLGSDLSGTATIRAEGRALREARATGHLTLEPSRLGEHSIDTAELDATLVHGTLALGTMVRSPAGMATLVASARPFDSAATLTVRHASFRDLELGSLLGVKGLRTRLAGTLRGTATGQHAREAQVAAELTLLPSVVNGVSIRSGRVGATLERGSAHLVGRLQGDGDSLTIDATSQPFMPRPPVRLTAQIASTRLGRLLGRDSLQAEGTANLALEGELGPRDSMRLRGTLAAGGRAGAVTLDSVRAAVSLASGQLDVDTLLVRSNVGAIDGGGSVALFGGGSARSDLRLDAKVLDLAPVASTLDFGTLVVDSARATASLMGTRDRPRARLTLDARELVVGGRRVGSVQAAVDAVLRSDRTIAGGKGSLLLDRVTTYSGRVGSLRLEGGYDGQELALHAASRLDATTRAWTAVRIYPGPHVGRLELDTLEARSELSAWGLSHPVRITFGDRIRVDDLVFRSRASRIALDGTLDRQGTQRFRATIDSLPLGWIAEVLGVGSLGGWADGALAVDGPAATPQVTGTVAASLGSRNRTVGRARAEVAWASPRGLRFGAGLFHPEGDSLHVTGELPVALSLAMDSSGGLVRRIPRGQLAMDLTAQRFRIDRLEALIDPAIVTKLAGRLTADVHARGEVDSPALSGTFALENAQARLTRLAATYRSPSISGSLDSTEIRLNKTRLESGEGTVDASGTMRFQGAPAAALDLRADLRDFRAADAEDLRSTVSGNLHLGGTAAAPVLAGTFQLKNTDFYLKAKNLEHGAESVELTARDLQTIEQRFGVVAEPSPGRPLAAWALDLNVDLAGNNWLRRRTNPVIAVELDGKVRIQKAHGEQAQLFGTIQPRHGRSFVQMLGRRFDVTGGQVALQGPTDRVRMTILSEYRADSGGSALASGVVITSEVAVDTGQLAVKLGSQPPMSNADIRSYLATGRPAGTDPTLNTEQTDVLSAGASLAVGAALGTVAGTAGQRLGLDVVQVLQDRQGAQTLVAGKYVSPPLYLGFRQPIVARDDPAETQSSRETMEWEVEYAALRRALLNVQGAGNELRVFLRLRQ